MMRFKTPASVPRKDIFALSLTTGHPQLITGATHEKLTVVTNIVALELYTSFYAIFRSLEKCKKHSVAILQNS